MVLRQWYVKAAASYTHCALTSHHAVYTKKSQWDKPSEPAYPAGEAPLNDAPPSYAPGAGGPVGAHTTGTSEKSSFSSNNPYANVNVTDDEKYARQLQQEEEARARSHGPGASGAGASHDYYGQPGQPQPNQYGGGGYPQQSGTPYGQSQTPMHDTQPQERSGKKGLLGKLISKAQGHGSSSSSHGYPPQQQHYGQPGYGAPMGAPMGGGYYQQPGRPMMGGGMGGGMMPGRRPGGGGMGPGGAMALGAGGGLLGGALLGSAMADGGDGGDTYINNDYGDGDMGGGDMGGDMGDMGGDF